MGCCKSPILGQHYAISALILLILSSTHLSTLNVEGRNLVEKMDTSQTVSEDKAQIIGSRQIGSRPPRCERRCSSCAHCEAIQVPTNPQTRNGIKNQTTTFSTIAYSRGEDYSNYKPMSWKCKCGNLIFNP